MLLYASQTLTLAFHCALSFSLSDLSDGEFSCPMEPITRGAAGGREFGRRRIQMSNGYMGKLLEVDLTARSHRAVPLDEELAKKYVGGSGLAAHFLLAEASADLDPLGPGNTLALMAGPMTGTVVPTS